MLAPAGFDPGRDIVAITVNRGHMGMPMSTILWDPQWAPEDEPCVRARQPFGRITIANSDAAAYAYADAAIDQGYRAVQELCMMARLTSSQVDPQTAYREGKIVRAIPLQEHLVVRIDQKGRACCPTRQH